MRSLPSNRARCSVLLSVFCLGGWLALPSLAQANQTQTHTVEGSVQAVPAAQSDEGAARRTLTVTIRGKNEWHINDQGPMSLTLKPSPGAKVAQARLGRSDLTVSTPDTASFSTMVQATRGPASVEAHARFVMCHEEACKMVEETLTVVVKPKAQAKKRRKSALPQSRAPRPGLALGFLPH